MRNPHHLNYHRNLMICTSCIVFDREAQSRFQEKEQDLSNRIDALQQEQRRLEDRSVAAHGHTRRFENACVQPLTAD